MVKMYVIPNFNFKLQKKEAGDYTVYLLYNGQFLPLWRMWCSSLRWAIADCYNDFDKELNEMFGEEEKEFIFKENTNFLFSKEENNHIDLVAAAEARARFKLPHWEDKIDIYTNYLLAYVRSI